jgi:MAP/microtubule affinity-regulating kinase
MVFAESEMLKSLVHKNIVKIYKCFTLSNMQVVFIMEYCEGGELLGLLEEKGRFTEPTAQMYFK